LFLGYGIVSACSFDGRIVPETIVVNLIGEIGKAVGSRREFPNILYNPSDLAFISLASCVVQQAYHIINTK